MILELLINVSFTSLFTTWSTYLCLYRCSGSLNSSYFLPSLSSLGSGRGFRDLDNKLLIIGIVFNNVNSDREDDKTQGFALNRVYFTYKNQISEKASFKFQADMQNKNTTETTAYYMFIKKAQIDLSVFDGEDERQYKTEVKNGVRFDPAAVYTKRTQSTRKMGCK